MADNSEPRNVVPSILTNDTVLAIGPLAISLYNKGYYGIPEHEGLRLNGFEALHLLELGRITVSKENQPLTEERLLEYFNRLIPQFTLRYLVYKDLRNRGYVVNLGGGSSFFFRLYARNTKPKIDGAKYYVTSLSEGGSIALKELETLIRIAEKSSKDLLLGMVDAIGDVSYLNVTEIRPRELDKKIFSDFSEWDWKQLHNKYREWEEIDS